MKKQKNNLYFKKMAKKQAPLSTLESVLLGLTIVGGIYTVYKYFNQDKPTTGNNTSPPAPPTGGGGSACPTWSGTIPTVAVLTTIRELTADQVVEALDFLPTAEKPSIRLCSAGIHIAYLQRLYNLRRNSSIQIDGKCGPITSAAFNIGTGEKTAVQIYSEIG